MAALARRFKVARETVSRCLSGDDFKEIEQAALEHRKTEALKIIQNGVVEAAEHWKRTFPKATEKGDHKPMADWLKAGGVIEDKDQPRIVVQVGVKLSGRQEVD